jgi:BrnA antitoxin of type II toxin-antitoxin system
MRKTYDFRKGRRGTVVPLLPGKTRITIRLDNDVIDWFRSQVEARGGGSYQGMINSALKEHVQRGGEALEALLRRVIREELQNRIAGVGLQPPL